MPYVKKKESFLTDERFGEKLQNQFATFELCELMASALTFHYDSTSLNYLDWNLLLLLLLNPAITDCLLRFLKENDFNENLEKEKVFQGVQRVFEKDSILYLEKNSLTNLFNFLQIEPYARDVLISMTLYSNNFTAILQYLSNKQLILKDSSKK